MKSLSPAPVKYPLTGQVFIQVPADAPRNLSCYRPIIVACQKNDVIVPPRACQLAGAWRLVSNRVAVPTFSRHMEQFVSTSSSVAW